MSYLDYHGGLWEQSGDTVLAILPGQLSAQHDLPETALITDDPDIAREDGVLFLGSGHPEIDKGAETIIGSGDVGALTLPHRAKQTSTEDLLAKIRDQVPVDHGRIDATGSILRSHRSLLRLGALVSHTVSADEQFTEVAECLLDVPSRVAWAQDAADRLLSAIGTAEATAGPEVPASRLASAVAAAHRELDTAAARRGQELSIEADAERARRSPARRSTTQRRWRRSTSVVPARTNNAGPCWMPAPRRRSASATVAWPRSARSTAISTCCAPTGCI